MEPLYLLLGALALGGTAYALATSASSTPVPGGSGGGAGAGSGAGASSTALTPAQISAYTAALNWVGAYNANAQGVQLGVATGSFTGLEAVVPPTAAQALTLSQLTQAQITALDLFSQWAILQALVLWALKPDALPSSFTATSGRVYQSPVPTTVNMATGQTVVNNPAAGVSGRPVGRILRTDLDV